MTEPRTAITRTEVALFGGSFDPPHLAHVMAALYALSVTGVARVLVVPTYAHAFDKQLTPFDHRLKMTELAMSDLRRVDVLPVESTLGAPSRTIRTVEHLGNVHPDWQLRLLIGADALAECDKWLSFDEIVTKAPLIVLGRQGATHPDAPRPILPDISSTRIRELLRSTPGARTSNPELTGSVPTAVLGYIDEHGLYRKP